MSFKRNKDLFMNVEKVVINAVTESLGMAIGDVTTASTRESLDMDSLDDIECLMFIEEEFEIEIPDEAAEKLNSIQETIDYIKTVVE